MPGHNLPMAIAGTFILAFGWFGFNPGSTLAGTDLRIAVVAVNTMLASATGGALRRWSTCGCATASPTRACWCNGMLAGLVAITAPCAFVNSVVAVLIGAIAGVLVVVAAFFIERTLKIDDPVGAIAVHGVNGAWGVLVARPVRRRHLRRRLERRARHGQGAVLRRCLAAHRRDDRRRRLHGLRLHAFFLFFKLLEATIGNRVSAEVEIEGLDMPEMGMLGYPADVAHEAVGSGMGTVLAGDDRGALRPATE